MCVKASKGTTSVDKHLQSLSIASTKSSRGKQTPETWDDEDVESPSNRPDSPKTPTQETVPDPPPPTPISPTHRRGQSTDWASFPQNPSQRGEPGSRGEAREWQDRRPEKSNLVAGRMIAGALGVKGPRMTEEQKTYERAVRDKERKRIDAEKESARRKEMEQEEAKRAIWDD